MGVAVDSEIGGLLVVAGPWVFGGLPVVVREPLLSSERPRSPPSVLRGDVPGSRRQIVQFCVGVRSRRILDGFEARRSHDHSQFGPLVLAHLGLQLREVQLHCLVGRWARSLLVREVSLDGVDGLGTDGVGGGRFGRFLVVVLRRWGSTASGPGWRWICGIR